MPKRKKRGDMEPSELLGLRLPPPLMELLKEATRKDMHITTQELIREAVREHLRREYPELYEKYKERIK